MKNTLYRGRFAPSPSGHLHFGSLVTALASFLDAKSYLDPQGNSGVWLVRIDDIDPPREQVGASTAILKSLEAYGLHWDEKVLYQSTQTPYYREILAHLHQQQLSYYCSCTRAAIKATNGIYQGTCRIKNHPAEHNATRLINTQGIFQFNDIIQDHVTCDKALAEEDFIIHRKDGLFAYQLAVVADDIYQKITHVIRGCDLLEPTSRQLSLFKTLNTPPPCYGHVPLAITSKGYKLSKQNKAPEINVNHPQPTLISALIFLKQQPPETLIHATVDEIITWAIQHWSREKIPSIQEITI